MIRPMASNGSALSSIVANGYQANWTIWRWPSIADSNRMKSRKSGGWFRNGARKLSNAGLNTNDMGTGI